MLIIEPFIGAVVLTMWIGAYAVVFGVFLLVLAFQLNSKREAQIAAGTGRRVHWHSESSNEYGYRSSIVDPRAPTDLAQIYERHFHWDWPAGL